MPSDLLKICQHKKPHLILDEFKKPTGKRVMKWVDVEVKDLKIGEDIRCAYCHGPVKIHRKRKATGPAEHVEHKDHKDTVMCKAGDNFVGPEHQMSLNQVP